MAKYCDLHVTFVISLETAMHCKLCMQGLQKQGGECRSGWYSHQGGPWDSEKAAGCISAPHAGCRWRLQVQKEQMLEEILRKSICINVYPLKISFESNFAVGSFSLCRKICFNQGIRCDSRCSCKACGNQPTMDDVEESTIRMKIDIQAPTPKVKINKPMTPVPNSAASSDESVFSGPPALPVEYTYGYDYELPSARVEEVWMNPSMRLKYFPAAPRSISNREKTIQVCPIPNMAVGTNY